MQIPAMHRRLRRRSIRPQHDALVGVPPTRACRGVMLLLLGASLAAAQAVAPPPASATVAEEVVKLSVFEVSTSKDIGYQAANAAEATRMNTPCSAAWAASTRARR